MKAESDVYIQLQNIYKRKARKDIDEVLEILGTSLNENGIEKEEVETYCKNAAFVKLLHMPLPDLERIHKLASKILHTTILSDLS
jgi:amyloid beta precursor protein binding protein 1